MVDSTMDVTSPGYFARTFSVNMEQAAELSRQAGLVSRTGGGGITAEAPHAAPSAPPSRSSTPALSATDAYAQLQADRTAGKVSTDEYRKQERMLSEQIASGNGALPLSVAPPAAIDQFAQYFAPPSSAEEYRFPQGATTPTDEQMAADSALKVAMHQAQMPQSLVESIAENLSKASRTLANETPEQFRARVDGNRARMTDAWGKEGVGFEQAMQTIDALLDHLNRNPTLRPYLANVVRFLGPGDFYHLFDFAKYKGFARR